MNVIALYVGNRTDIASRGDLLLRVSPKRRDRIARYMHKEDAVRSMAAELLARHAIGRLLGVPGAEIAFGANAYGKPILAGDSGLHFNLSHSGEWVLCAVSNRPVGVDVEQIKPTDAAIADRWFTEAELAYIRSSPENGQTELERFFEIWTLKESCIKAIGEGLSIPLQSFSVRPDTSTNRVAAELPVVWPRLYFRQYELHSEYKCAVCSYGPDFPETIEFADAETLFGMSFTAEPM